MRKRRGDGHQGAGAASERPPVIPLEPIDLLAGLATGIELETDDLPAGVAGAEETTAVRVSVNEVGRLLRSEDATIRRLIRTPAIRPGESEPRGAAPRGPIRDPEKPGE
ncbi:MAG: hypothetical protein U0807_11120 [Candidatus Binatia bacterium]